MEGSEGAWFVGTANTDGEVMNEKTPLLTGQRDRDNVMQDYSSESRFVAVHRRRHRPHICLPLCISYIWTKIHFAYYIKPW